MRAISNGSRLGKAAATGVLAAFLCASQFPIPLQAKVLRLGAGDAIEVAGGVTVVGNVGFAGTVNVGGATVVSSGSVLAAGSVVAAGSVLNDEDCDHYEVLAAPAAVTGTTVLAAG